MSALEAEYLRFVREEGVARLFGDEPPAGPPNPFESGEFEPDVAEATIRNLEASRAYLSYETVGTEPRADWLFRLGTVASRRGPYQAPILRSLRGVLELRTADVRRGVEEQGRAWPPVHVDLFPTGDLNAMSVPVHGGWLVLVNTGLMNLAFNVLKIHVLSQRIGPDRDDGPLVTEHQVELLLAEAMNAYVYGAGSWMTWSTPSLDKRRHDLIAPTLSLCEDFVLAHEIGHVLAGDRDAPKLMAAPSTAPVPGLPVPSASHEAEHAADRLGAATVRASFGVDARIGPADERTLYAGLLFFFLLDGAVRALAHELDRTASDSHTGVVETHPPAGARMERLVEAFPPVHDTSLTLLTSFAEWFQHYLPRAQAQIMEVNDTVVRRDEPWWRLTGED